LQSAASRNAITAIAPDRDGTIWVGTDGDGLFHIEKAWRKCDGLLSDWVRTLYLDQQGVLWIGTSGGGLSRLKGGKMTTFTTRVGLPDNTISQLLEDDLGNLWLGGDRGLVCVAKQDLEDLAAQKVAAVYPQVYGRAEGMLSEECISGFFPIGLRTQSGLLWFPTQEGIVVADPHHQIIQNPKTAVVLEETLVDGVVDNSESLRLAPGKHRLEFRYTGINFDAPERVRFRYRLEGLDSDWVDAGSSRTASFPYVPYGNYRFEVIAENGKAGWNTKGASLPVVVQPQLWQTWWFRVPASVVLLGIIAVGARVWEKRKLQRRLEQLERERALAHERERIARDLHDDLGSSLARISLLSGLLRSDRDNPNQIESHAVKISQSADQTVRALEEIVWAVRPGSDSLQSLVEYIAHFANELFDGGGIRCRLDLPADLPSRPLPPDVRHNIFLVVKEALTNAIKHAAAHEVLVRAEATEHALEIVVQDDGKGFDTKQQSRGNGLGNMRRRVQAMGGSVTIESCPGQGTVVRLKMDYETVALALS
jgi:signal transduction histidine kinase